MSGQSYPIKRKFLLYGGLAAILATIFFAGSCSCRDDTQRMASLTIGMEATAVNALIYIAAEQRYFEANGLRVIIDDSYPSGARAVEHMLEGHADVATAAETSIVRSALDHRPARILAGIDMFMHMKLVGRRDRSIHRIADLAGKRIGVPLNTAADFKLGRFLDLHAIDRSQVTIVDVQAPRAVASLSEGVVDAVVTWPPHVLTLRDRLGPAAATWSVQSGQPIYCLLVTTDQWATRHPGMVRRLLRSLLQAEEFLIRKEAAARAIVQQRLGYDDRHIANVWPEHQFSVRLDQSLILAMEDQARWMIANGLTAAQEVPDFLTNLHTGDLEALRPEAVSIIRSSHAAGE